MRQQEAIQNAMIKREFDHSYLMIRADAAELESYPFIMISRNTIKGLLTCRIRYIEEIPYYNYDISSKKPLVQEYQDKRLHFEDLKELFYSISEIIKRAGEYLLEAEGFIFSPEYIYKDLETEQYFCLYLPKGEIPDEEKNGRYRELADFLLDRTDHKDEHGVNCVYQFYKMSKESYFSFDSFLGFIEKEDLMIQAEKRRSPEHAREEVSTAFIQEMEEKEQIPDCAHMQDGEGAAIGWIPPMILCVIGLICIAAYFCVPMLRKYTLYIVIPGGSLVILSLILALRNLYELYRRKKEAEWVMPVKETTVEEYFDDVMDKETVYFEDEPCFHLKWKEGHFSKEFYLRELPVTVGKMKEGLCIEDDSVSRLHACFKEKGKEILLQDLDSTNGTYVNGKSLAPGEECVVNRGDEIQFGKITVNVV